MLVLRRKLGESITAGDMLVRVMDCTGGRVLLGIDVPDDIEIMRTELLDPAGEQQEIDKVCHHVKSQRRPW